MTPDLVDQAEQAPNVKPVGPVPPVLAPPGATAVPQAVLQKFIQNPQGSVQVGELNAQTAKALGTNSAAVLLSAGTMKKQLGLLNDKAGHPEVFVKHYAALDALIARPVVVYPEGLKAVRLIGRIGDLVATVVIKRTEAAHETYLKSFHFAGERFLIKRMKHKAIIGEIQTLLEFSRKQVR